MIKLVESASASPLPSHVSTHSRWALLALRAVSAAALFAASAVAGAAPQVIHVPTDRPTIQSAIDAAVSGDTVLVAPGTYREHIDFEGKAITVTSEAGPETTIIDGGRTGSVVRIHSEEGPQTVLSGFTIQGGLDAGIAMGYASPTITGNRVIANEGCRGAISIGPGGPLIQRNTIAGNSITSCGTSEGGGIYLSNREGPGPAGSPAARILDNVIEDNNADFGGGILLDSARGVVIKGNVIRRNLARYGGGIAFLSTCSARVIGNLIVQNRAGRGGGLESELSTGSDVELLGNTIAWNMATTGSQIASDPAASPGLSLENNIIVGLADQPAISCGASTAPLVRYRFNLAYGLGGTVIDPFCAVASPPADGNLIADPLFADLAAEEPDYHLAANSPAIDAGTSLADLPETDLDGNARVVDGSGDCTAGVDMGAYEAAPARSAVRLDAYGFDLGMQFLGTPFPERTLTVTNGTDLALAFCAITTTGAGYAARSHCGTSIPPRSSCELSVGLTAASVGAQPGKVQIQLGGGAPPLVVSVSATAITTLSVSPSSDSVEVGGRRTLTAAGGTGTGHVWILLENSSNGSIDRLTGEYQAGDHAGTDIVQLTDSGGLTATATIAVTEAGGGASGSSSGGSSSSSGGSSSGGRGGGGGGGCNTGVGTSLLGVLALGVLRRRRGRG